MHPLARDLMKHCCHGFMMTLAVTVVLLSAPTTLRADDANAVSVNAAIEQGLDLEKQHSWEDAIRHYDKQTRLYPDDKTLYQRLIICRLHYDVKRRYQDTSFRESIDKIGTNQALDLYGEILANLQSHYVDEVEWSRVFLYGTASLEVALTEDRFIEHLLPNVDAEKIEKFRQGLHKRIQNRENASRHDLRANAAYVAQLANVELGIPTNATIMEYVGGAVSTLDPYTRLLSGQQLDEMFSGLEGNLVGLGVELKSGDKCLDIVSVIESGPAEDAGVKAGDKIVSVAGSRTDEVDPNVVADLLRGPAQSYVTLTVVNKDGRSRELRIQRRRVEVPCVKNIHLVDLKNRVGYFRLTSFQKTTVREIENAIWNLQRQGMTSLIIDVRGNPGGLLTPAIEIADRFLTEGKIVTTRGRNVRENFEYVAHRPNTWQSIPLAVLIDDESASASEVFAGAIGDSGRGKIVGETSFGKGSVQGIFRMHSSKFGLCLTTSKFYSPSGRAISHNGVQPTLAVEKTHITERPNDAGEITSDTADAVLQAAIESMASRKSLISKRQ